MRILLAAAAIASLVSAVPAHAQKGKQKTITTVRLAETGGKKSVVVVGERPDETQRPSALFRVIKKQTYQVFASAEAAVIHAMKRVPGVKNPEATVVTELSPKQDGEVHVRAAHRGTSGTTSIGMVLKKIGEGQYIQLR
jgi:hypothetical protein